jgi:hypothetical protein
MKNLRKAVIKQLGGIEVFNESLHDIINHGADGGVGGFIYYWETNRFAKRNREAILRLVDDCCDDQGLSRLDFLAHFNCLKGYTPDELGRGLYSNSAKDSDMQSMVNNALSWFALEQICYIEELEREDAEEEHKREQLHQQAHIKKESLKRLEV